MYAKFSDTLYLKKVKTVVEDNFSDDKIYHKIPRKSKHQRTSIERKSFEQRDFFERVKTNRAWCTLSQLSSLTLSILGDSLGTISHADIEWSGDSCWWAICQFPPHSTLNLTFRISVWSLFPSTWFFFSVPVLSTLFIWIRAHVPFTREKSLRSKINSRWHIFIHNISTLSLLLYWFLLYTIFIIIINFFTFI